MKKIVVLVVIGFVGVFLFIVPDAPIVERQIQQREKKSLQYQLRIHRELCKNVFGIVARKVRMGFGQKSSRGNFYFFARIDLYFLAKL